MRSRTPRSPALARRDRAFGLLEVFVALAIIAILIAALGLILQNLRSSGPPIRRRADIQAISNALELYRSDIGSYPVAPWGSGYTPIFADEALFAALTDRNAGGPNRGWGSAADEWDFVTASSRAARHFLDPWGLPYYYISHDDYLRGVGIHDPTEDPGPGHDWPRIYGTTPVPNDFGADDPTRPPKVYYGSASSPDIFYCPATFQLYSKGPDRKTAPGPCDRGTDADDISNLGGK